MQVRDRCTLYLAHLEGKAGVPDMVVPRLDVPLANLEKALQEYLAGTMDAPFNIDAVDRTVEEPAVPVYVPAQPAPCAACVCCVLDAVCCMRCAVCCVLRLRAF
jgi:hypothetical protein